MYPSVINKTPMAQMPETNRLIFFNQPVFSLKAATMATIDRPTLRRDENILTLMMRATQPDSLYKILRSTYMTKVLNNKASTLRTIKVHFSIDVHIDLFLSLCWCSIFIFSVTSCIFTSRLCVCPSGLLA